MSIIAKEIIYHADLLNGEPWLDYEQDYELCLIIPAFKETQLSDTIRSLEACFTDRPIGIIILINESELVNPSDSEINERCYGELISYSLANEHLHLYVFYLRHISHKKAGVGIARRLAMDQAVHLCADASTPIINLDADCTVNRHYFRYIYESSRQQTKVELFNIHFEHPLEHEDIVSYELHLRYFIEAQRYINLPYAYHTVGSSFAVRSGAYVQVGRMNQRKAGEDFYFIHKFTKKGTMGCSVDARVYPSARQSDRVPFGTGRAMIQMDGAQRYHTYQLDSFLALKPFLDRVEEAYQDRVAPPELLALLPSEARIFFEKMDFDLNFDKLGSNAKSPQTFYKAFYQWFDAFKLMKYLHHMRSYHYADQEVAGEAMKLLRYLGDTNLSDLDHKALLHRYRILQQNGWP